MKKLLLVITGIIILSLALVSLVNAKEVAIEIKTIDLKYPEGNSNFEFYGGIWTCYLEGYPARINVDKIDPNVLITRNQPNFASTIKSMTNYKNDQNTGLNYLLNEIKFNTKLNSGQFNSPEGYVITMETIRDKPALYYVKDGKLIKSDIPVPNTSTDTNTTTPTDIGASSVGPQQTWNTISFTGLPNPSKIQELGELFTKYLPEIIITIAGMIFVVALVLGGFWYITSAGSEEQADKGKKTLLWAIMGIIIVALAALAVNWFKEKIGAPQSSSSTFSTSTTTPTSTGTPTPNK